MNPFERLAVIMITRDAAEVLPGAIRSVPAGAEVIVADGRSTDATVEIARGCGARVVAQDLDAIERAGGVFDVARNQAAAETRRPWLLHLDADERLTPELARQIGAVLAGDPPHAAYDMPRVNLYWGRPVRLLGEDRQIRLVRRNRGRFSSEHLHRRLEVDGTTGSLDAVLTHLNVRSWSEVARWFRCYVPIEARTLGRRPGLYEAAARAPHLFNYYFFRNRAFLDGGRGLLVSAIYAAYGGAIYWAARRSHGDPH